MKIKNGNKLIIILLLVLLSGGLTSVSPVRLGNTVPTQFKVRNASLNINDLNSSSFDAQIEQFMNEGHIPSLAASVIDKDKMVWAKGYGEQSDVDTVYYLYSITKTFTATAILQLYERGLINLDDDVNDTLPFNLRHPNYPDIPITYRHLLSHRSSIDEDFGNLLDISEIARFPDYIKEMLVPSGKYYESNNWDPRQPGTSTIYTQLDFILLAYLVELISNKTIADYFSDNILNPLNMSNTRWKPSDYENESILAIPYEWNPGTQKHIEQPQDDINLPGAGGLRSTVSDLSHFLIAHMNGGMYNNVHILTNSSVELMHTTIDKDYGLGWTTDIDDEESHLWWYNALPTSDYRTNLQGHGGGSPGMPLKCMVFDSTYEIGLIVFQNQGFANVPPSQINLLTIQGYILETAGVPAPLKVTIDSPLAQTYTTDTITVTLSGNAAHYWYYIESLDNKNRTWTASMDCTLADGIYTLHAYGNNSVGNVAHVSVMFEIETTVSLTTTPTTTTTTSPTTSTAPTSVDFFNILIVVITMVSLVWVRREWKK